MLNFSIFLPQCNLEKVWYVCDSGQRVPAVSQSGPTHSPAWGSTRLRSRVWAGREAAKKHLYWNFCKCYAWHQVGIYGTFQSLTRSTAAVGRRLLEGSSWNSGSLDGTCCLRELTAPQSPRAEKTFGIIVSHVMFTFNVPFNINQYQTLITNTVPLSAAAGPGNVCGRAETRTGQQSWGVAAIAGDNVKYVW